MHTAKMPVAGPICSLTDARVSLDNHGGAEAPVRGARPPDVGVRGSMKVGHIFSPDSVRDDWIGKILRTIT